MLLPVAVEVCKSNHNDAAISATSNVVIGVPSFLDQIKREEEVKARKEASIKASEEAIMATFGAENQRKISRKCPRMENFQDFSQITSSRPLTSCLKW